MDSTDRAGSFPSRLILPAGAGNHAKTQAGGTAWTVPPFIAIRIPSSFVTISLGPQLTSSLAPPQFQLHFCPPSTPSLPLSSFLVPAFPIKAHAQLPGQSLVPSVCPALHPVTLSAGPGDQCLPPRHHPSFHCVFSFSSSFRSPSPSLPFLSIISHPPH